MVSPSHHQEFRRQGLVRQHLVDQPARRLEVDLDVRIGVGEASDGLGQQQVHVRWSIGRPPCGHDLPEAVHDGQGHTPQRRLVERELDHG